MTLAIFFMVLVVGVIVGLPGTWLVMLAAGNFGFTQIGFADCIPAGILVGLLITKGSSDS